MAIERIPANIPSAPHVDCRCISSELEKKLRRTVPSGYDKGGVIAHGISIASAGLRYRAIVVTSQTKVGNLEQAAVVDEDVGS